MNIHLEEAEAQIHYWPWSCEISAESRNLTNEIVEFHFLGSPIITLSEKAELFLSSRVERFRPLGYTYDSGYQVYDTPHGILTGTKDSKKLKIRSSKGIFDVSFNIHGAAKRYIGAKSDNKKRQDSQIARYLLAWSQVFDDLLDNAHKTRGRYTSEIMWSEVIDLLEDLRKDLTQPRMAIIVRISEAMHRRLPEIVSTARRILLRDRDLIPVHRIQESDSSCLKWYIRQPGNTMPEKAGHKQRLLGVVRRESFNTLENQVLKDFILRCRYEAARYLQGDITSQHVRSRRAIKIQGFKHICNTHISNPVFEQVSKPSPGVQPNYVLQNDLRYKEIWHWYRKLLRRENEEDELWDWQPRTWADVMRLLIGAALELLHGQKKGDLKIRNGFVFEPLVNAPFSLRMEQERGCRLVADSLPGPFQITRIINGQHKEKMVIELVHPDLASKHQIVQYIGRVGGHLYMVVHPLGANKIPKSVIIFWSVNGAGVDNGINIREMARSAFEALKQHSTILNLRREFPILRGIIVASTLNERGELVFMRKRNRLPVLTVNADPRTWRQAIDSLSTAISDLLEQCYEQ